MAPFTRAMARRLRNRRVRVHLHRITPPIHINKNGVETNDEVSVEEDLASFGRITPPIDVNQIKVEGDEESEEADEDSISFGRITPPIDVNQIKVEGDEESEEDDEDSISFGRITPPMDVNQIKLEVDDEDTVNLEEINLHRVREIEESVDSDERNSVEEGAFIPTCGFCLEDLWKPAEASTLRGYLEHREYIGARSGRWLDRTALESVVDCGHIVHLTCLNIHWGQLMAHYMESVWCQFPQGGGPLSPLPRCYHGDEIKIGTHKAVFPGYDEKKLNMNGPIREEWNRQRLYERYCQDYLTPLIREAVQDEVVYGILHAGMEEDDGLVDPTESEDDESRLNRELDEILENH